MSEYEVRSLDIPTKTDSSSGLSLSFPIMRIEQTEVFETLGGKKWLTVWMRRSSCGGENEFRLYNLCTLEQTAKWKGELGRDFAFISTSNTTCTLCFLESYCHELSVFTLDETNGKLSFCRSFKVHCGSNNAGCTMIMALTKSHVVIDLDFGAGGSYAKVYDLVPSSFKEKYGESIAVPARILDIRPYYKKGTVSLVRNELCIYGRQSDEGVCVFCWSEPTNLVES